MRESDPVPGWTETKKVDVDFAVTLWVDSCEDGFFARQATMRDLIQAAHLSGCVLVDSRARTAELVLNERRSNELQEMKELLAATQRELSDMVKSQEFLHLELLEAQAQAENAISQLATGQGAPDYEV